MLKSELRKIYLEKRNQLSFRQMQVGSESIMREFINKFQPIQYQKIHCFLPIKKFKEVNTFPLIYYCLENKVKVFVPKVCGSRLLALPINETTYLEENTWGIPEPQVAETYEDKDFDIVITPLLYCDPQGNRVGYGKGFYDQLFSEIHPRCLKIGVSYFPPEESITDVWEGDRALDYLVIPDAVLSFKGG